MRRGRTVRSVRRVPRTFSALAIPNFRRYFIGQSISTIGTWMQMLAQAWLVLELTGSGRALGFTAALQTIPVALLSPWGGVVADRRSRRAMVTVTEGLGAAQAIVLATMTLTGTITVAWIYAFSVLLGIVVAFGRPAQQALLYELAGPDELASGVGLNSMITATGRLIGPAIGGAIIALANIATCFFVNAASFGAMLVALALVRPDALHGAALVGRERPKLRDGLAYVWRRPELRHALVVMFVVGTFAYNFATTMPSMVKFVFDAGAGTLGLAQSASGLGATLGAVLLGGLGKPNRRRFGLLTVAFGALIALTALSPRVGVFVVMCAPLGVASAMFSATDQLVLQQGTEPGYQGRVMSLFTLAWLGTTPIGALIIGFAIEQWSARVAMGLGAAATLASGCLTLSPLRRFGARRRELPAWHAGG